jgi:hypothetical protein
MTSFRQDSPSQSAVNGLQAGGDIRIGDVTQNINLSRDQYDHIALIIAKYDKKIADLEKEHESNRQFNHIRFYQEIKEYWKKLNQDAEDYEKRASETAVTSESYSIYIRKSGELREDADELKHLIDPLEQLSKQILLSALGLSDQAKTLWESSTRKLSIETRQNIRDLKARYEAEQRKLEENLNQQVKNCDKERNSEIYTHLFLQKLEQGGYPLSFKSREELNFLLQRFNNLTQTDVEHLEKGIAKPFYQKNLQNYKQEYTRQIEKKGYPLESDSIVKLKGLKKSLGIEDLAFTDLDVQSVEEEIIKPYYQENLHQYKQLYSQKLEHEGYPLSSNGLNQLQLSKTHLGLDFLFFENLGLQDRFSVEFDVRNLEKLATKPFYQKNLQKYRQELLQKIAQEGDLVSYSTCTKLKELQQSLGLRIEDVGIVEALVKKHWEIDYLVSSKFEVDYWKLGDFLADKEWRKADEQTRAIILKIAGREAAGSLDKKSIENFPDQDLFTIDRFWIEYSEGRFGLSIQKKIFDGVKQNKQNFAEKVGWSGKAGLFGGAFAWKSYNELIFSLSAPEGHLPVWGAKDKKIFEGEFFHLNTWNFGKENSGSEQPSAVIGLNFSNLPEVVIFAFYGVLFAMAASDGSTAPEELKYIFESMDEYNVPESVKNNLISYQANPPRLEDCLNGLSLVNEEVRWELFFHLIQVSLVDKILAPAEERTVQLVQSHFKVTDRQLKAVQAFVQTMMRIGEDKLNPQQVKEATQKVVSGLMEEAVPVPKAFSLSQGESLGSNQANFLKGVPLKKIGKFALGATIALAAIYGVSQQKS